MSRGQGIALVTGATGGIGAACARALSATHRPFLADLDAERLADAAAALAADGIEIAGHYAGNLAAAGEPERLVAAARAAGTLSAIVHCAGLSPAQADATAILRLNVGATEKLLDAVEETPEPGLTTVLIASIGGHFAPLDTAIDTLCATADTADFVDRAVPMMAKAGDDTQGRAAAGAAYTYAKRANILSAQRRCPAWAAAGMRIVSISPGLVDTTMGRAEVATDPGAAAMLELTPLRWVAPEQIAATAVFLISDAATAITGSDIKVDGGVLGAFFQGRSTTGACVA